MQVITEHYISLKECRYTYRGLNLVHMRRAQLSKLAAAFDIGNAQWSKNDLLTGLIGKLRTINAESEITDMIEE